MNLLINGNWACAYRCRGQAEAGGGGAAGETGRVGTSQTEDSESLAGGGKSMVAWGRGVRWGVARAGARELGEHCSWKGPEIKTPL